MNNMQKTMRIKETRKDSNSFLQVEIEKKQIEKLEKYLGKTGLGNESKLFFNGDPKAAIKPDIYSAEYHIIGEVYSHIGKLKSAQIHKITSDILKMILFEKESGFEFKKYYVVCDKEAKSSMLGNAVIRNAVRIHNIEIVCFELDAPMKIELLETMKKQDVSKS